MFGGLLHTLLQQACLRSLGSAGHVSYLRSILRPAAMRSLPYQLDLQCPACLAPALCSCSALLQPSCSTACSWAAAGLSGCNELWVAMQLTAALQATLDRCRAAASHASALAMPSHGSLPRTCTPEPLVKASHGLATTCLMRLSSASQASTHAQWHLRALHMQVNFSLSRALHLDRCCSSTEAPQSPRLLRTNVHVRHGMMPCQQVAKQQRCRALRLYTE